MYDIDLRERGHSKFLHNLLGEKFMAISGVDIEDWSLLKLATAIKKMCYPYEGTLVGNPYEVNLCSFFLVCICWNLLFSYGLKCICFRCSRSGILK